MSSDQQPLSIETQKLTIAAYAAVHGFDIICTYVDEAKSGITLAGRSGMQKLLRDVMDDDCPFKSILVLDVTRWGRFQDADEAAYHEYHCRKHGVSVEYAAEPFSAAPNSALNSIVKQMKRAMAGEYSRELAIKARAGQMRVVTMGFASSNLPCVGYRRQAVGADGTPKHILACKERKPMVTDHVRWVLGPKREQKLVRRIFREYTSGYPLTQLARDLNAEGARSHDGTSFSDTMLRSLVGNEIVRGVFAWGTRGKFRKARTMVARLPESLRIPGMVAPLISQSMWSAAQARIARNAAFHKAGYNKRELLHRLRKALTLCPELKVHDFSSAGLPGNGVYSRHFGSTAKALDAAGKLQSPGRLAFGEKLRVAQRLTNQFLSDVDGELLKAQIEVVAFPRRRLLVVNGMEVKVCVARDVSSKRTARWYLPFARKQCLPNRWLLVMRLNRDLLTGRDFFLLPPSVHANFSGVIRDDNAAAWDRHRATDAASLVALFCNWGYSQTGASSLQGREREL